MTAEERSKVIDRVRKLLALSTSNHEAEASLAMQKAGEILAKVGLTMEEVTAEKKEEAQVGSKQVVTNSDRTTWLSNLAFGVAKATDCRSLRGPGRNTRQHVMIFIGFRHDVDLATHFFAYLKEQVDALARSFERQYGRGRRGNEVDAYRMGVIRTVNRRLNEMFQARTAAEPQSTALVLVKKDRVDQAMSDMFPSTRRGTNRNSNGSHVAYSMGLKDGQSVGLHRPIAQSESASRERRLR